MFRGSTLLPSMTSVETSRVSRIGRFPIVSAALVAVVFSNLGPLAPAASAQSQTARLQPSDASAGNNFGISVSLSGSTAVVGANTAYGDVNSGAVYVFIQVDGVWTQQAKLVPNDGAAGDAFGAAVSISGETIVIGAGGEDDLGSASGSAYVFTRSAGVWTQQAKLLPNDGAAGDAFGAAVSISGETIVIGAGGDDDFGSASGSAYVFTRSAGVWTQQAKLLPSDGAANDQFSSSISISTDTIVCGASGDDDRGSDSGSAYVFTRSAGVWTQKAKLLPSDSVVNDVFGRSVSLDGDTAVIGANSFYNGYRFGAAYVFSRAAGVWTQQAKLVASDGAPWDTFGASVTVSGDTAVIGASYDNDNGVESGSAYVFTRTGGVWIQRAKLLANEGAPWDYFGTSASVSGQTTLIGTNPAEEYGNYFGSAYVFDLTPCPADLNSDGFVNGDDYDLFASWFEVADDRADITSDGFVNGDDYDAFADAFDSGC